MNCLSEGSVGIDCMCNEILAMADTSVKNGPNHSETFLCNLTINNIFALFLTYN